MIEIDERQEERPLLPQSFYSHAAAVGLLMMIVIKIITVYNAVAALSPHQKFSLSGLVCFESIYLFRREGQKLGLFFPPSNLRMVSGTEISGLNLPSTLL